jgi:glyoxylase-like metal-dependent hydrolase (beta-lactamase superfamily II)
MPRITKEGHLTQVTFLPNVFPVSCYLVEEDTDLTLIDTTMPFGVKGILQAAERLGKPIARIILTHAHNDHVGGLDGLKQNLPLAKVYISRRDSKLMAGSHELEPGEPETKIKGGVPKSLKTKADILLEDGDCVGSLKAIATPGHTPGHMAFMDTRSGALIAGDALVTRGGIAVPGTFKFWFPFPAFGTWNKEVALESARKLRQLSPTLLAVGHGVMLKKPLSAIDQAIEESAKALSKS